MTRKRTLRARIAELEADVERLSGEPSPTFQTATVILGPTGPGRPSAITFPVLSTGPEAVLDLPALGYTVRLRAPFRIEVPDLGHSELRETER